MEMNHETKLETSTKPRAFRFDIFKGSRDSSGKVSKLRSVGGAHLVEGCKTYTLYLKTFLNDVFYLLPEQKKPTEADYVVLTREPSQNPARKFYWNSVGSGRVLDGPNAGLMALSWDMLGCEDIFMSLYPRNPDGQ